jgi:hypothetical protein
LPTATPGVVVEVKLTGVVLAGEIEQDEPVRDPGAHLLVYAVFFHDIEIEIEIEIIIGRAEHQPMCTPVGHVEFVVLVLTHRPSTQSPAAKAFARKLESPPRWNNK